jgi:hypothetical protein
MTPHSQSPNTPLHSARRRAKQVHIVNPSLGGHCKTLPRRLLSSKERGYTQLTLRSKDVLRFRKLADRLGLTIVDTGTLLLDHYTR